MPPSSVLQGLILVIQSARLTLGFSRVLPALPAQSFRGLVLFSLLLTESAPIFSGFHSDKFTSDGTSTGHFRLGLGLFTSDGICINLFGVWFWDVFVRGCRRQEDERETALQAAFSLSTVPLRPPLSGPAHLCRRFPAHPLASWSVSFSWLSLIKSVRSPLASCLPA